MDISNLSLSLQLTLASPFLSAFLSEAMLPLLSLHSQKPGPYLFNLRVLSTWTSDTHNTHPSGSSGMMSEAPDSLCSCLLWTPRPQLQQAHQPCPCEVPCGRNPMCHPCLTPPSSTFLRAQSSSGAPGSVPRLCLTPSRGPCTSHWPSLSSSLLILGPWLQDSSGSWLKCSSGKLVIASWALDKHLLPVPGVSSFPLAFLKFLVALPRPG